MSNRWDRLNYPVSEQLDQVDNYHGVSVRDPFRWLEDGNSARTLAWIEEQNRLTGEVLAGIDVREPIRKRLTELWNFPRVSPPWRRGRRWFFFRNDGLQNQSVLYTTTRLEGRRPRVILDPNLLSDDGTVALTGVSVSDDGNLIAYGISRSGSDWQEWRVRDAATGSDRPDLIRWVKFSSASWTGDGQGFFYSRYDEPDSSQMHADANYFHKLYYHRLGTPQAQDVLVYGRADRREWGFSGAVTEDGDYLIISVWQGTNPRNRIFVKDLRRERGGVIELLSEADAAYAVIDKIGTVLFLRTDLNAPRGRVVAVDLAKYRGGRPELVEIIPESEDTLQFATVCDGKLVAGYLKDARTRVKIFDRKGRLVRDVRLPGLGSAGGFYGTRRSWKTYYVYTDFTMPWRIYRYDMRTHRQKCHYKPEVDFRPDDYRSEQVFYKSRDGTTIPMFITHHKGLRKDGANPVFLHGYGGFAASEQPYFSVAMLLWMEMGGVFAVPNIRGGGEYGERWHEAGMLANKQNSFDDFIAAAEWLIDNKYTCTPRLSISGTSNGGLLAGACLTQRPDLFGAAIIEVGVLDMLRYHHFTIGWAWVPEYGSVEDPEHFKTLYAYSPLHNIKVGIAYPPTLVLTADYDDRVVPAHSYKFIATLQAAQSGRCPVIIRVERQGGHGGGTPTGKAIESCTDRWAFLLASLDYGPILPL